MWPRRNTDVGAILAVQMIASAAAAVQLALGTQLHAAWALSEVLWRGSAVTEVVV
jgi:hypothetical protein